MEMRTGNATRRTDDADHLSPFHRISRCNEWLAQMEIGGHDTSAMIDIDDVSRQKEIVDERDDSAIGRAHLLANRSPKINAQVARSEPAIEETA
jgi:hypothetical protein